MKTWFLILTTTVCIATFAAGQSDSTKHDATHYLNLMVQAQAAGNSSDLLKYSRELIRLRPHNPQAVYNLGCAYAQHGMKDSALLILNRLVDVGLNYGIEQDPDLASIRGTAAYDLLRQRVDSMKTAVNQSQLAFVIKEKDLIPENIAYDPVTKTFFAGSLHKRKIVAVKPGESPQDFTKEEQDGMWCVLGMKVDAQRRLLWVVSSAEQEMKGYVEGEIGKKTAVFKYDLRSKRLLKKYVNTDTTQWHLFNDLVIDSKGNVFISDTFGGSVWVIWTDRDALEVFAKPENLTGANGIALSDDEKKLFVAYFSGIAAIDIVSKTSEDIGYRLPLLLAYADGLYFHRNSLIAIHTDQHRVNCYYLSGDQTEVDSVKVLEAYNPDFDCPTTGVLVDDTLYYIANSQYMSFDNNGIFPIEKLKDVVILKLGL